MNIKKIEKDLYESLMLTLKNYINAWHKIPKDIDVDNLNVIRIRYIKEWGLKTTPEDGFIIEFSTKSNFYRELIGRSEIGLTIDEFIEAIKQQNENGLLFWKDFVTNQEWYEYPVIFGNLDKIFDEDDYYEKGGKYENENYTNLGKKYD